MSDVEVNIEDATKGLELLDKKVATKIVKKGLRAGAKVTLATAKQLAPMQSGELRQNLKVRAGRSRKGTTSVIVGTDARKFNHKPYYSDFVEYGHQLYNPRAKKIIGKVEGAHFIEQAYNQTKGQALSTAVDSISAQISEATQ